MAEMFGTPIGSQAAIHDSQSLAQAQLIAVETATKVKALAEQQQLQDIASGIALADARARQGLPTSLEDLEKVGKSASQAEPLERFLRVAHEKGISPLRTAEAAKQAADIRQSEAAAANNQAKQETEQLTQQLKGAEILASFADAALQSPEQYDQMRLAAVQRGLPVQQLPQRFDAGALTALRDEGRKVEDAIKARQQKLKDDSSIALDASRKAQAEQAVKTGKARESYLKERTDLLKKNGGDNTKPLTEAQKVLAAQRKANMAAKSLKENPAPPADINDPLYDTPGQTFTVKGKIYQLIGRNAKGIPMVVPRPVASIPRIAQTADEGLPLDEELDLGD